MAATTLPAGASGGPLSVEAPSVVTRRFCSVSLTIRISDDDNVSRATPKAVPCSGTENGPGPIAVATPVAASSR